MGAERYSVGVEMVNSPAVRRHRRAGTAQREKGKGEKNGEDELAGHLFSLLD